ncbi:MAG: hypothetical protein ACTTJO_03440 [Metamycoplasmataceae bacterium]|uniref:hypothetical protein n=1 Tax=Mycoplasmopsis lipophila TaxID=2117 RepID=UPI0038736A5C
MKNFKKLNNKKQTEIYGGSFLGIASTVVPLISQGLTAIGTFIKIIKSKNGSYESNTGNANWNDGSNDKKTEPTKKNPSSSGTSSGPTIIAF